MNVRRSVRSAFALIAALAACLGARPEGPPPAAARPIRGVLLGLEAATPAALDAWKAGGGNAVVVTLDESVPRDRWAALAGSARAAGLDLYAWIEVGRNPDLADRNPSWMASPGGHHADWRRRFPDAPADKPGRSIKLWPWVPIGYEPAFEAHRRRILGLLDGLPGPWAGALLNDLQGGPSACGCGNDQCRWALDYGSKPTAAIAPGDDAAARLVAEVRRRQPGKAVIPVWVTECEAADLPDAEGGTGHCGSVGCAEGACWPRYRRAWEPLVASADGPLAVALWPEPFRRRAGWIPRALDLFLRPPGGPPLDPDRALAVLQGWGDPAADPMALAALAAPARAGWIVARTRIDQSWSPRFVPAPE